jgi:hypothetical protein
MHMTSYDLMFHINSKTYVLVDHRSLAHFISAFNTQKIKGHYFRVCCNVCDRDQAEVIIKQNSDRRLPKTNIVISLW